MRITFIMAAVGLLSTFVSYAQIKNAKTETIKVYGNCGMCEATIEKAGTRKNFSKTDWNEDSKMASITYDSKKTDLDAVLKSIALSGYDNPKYLAPDEAYAKLPACCKYDRYNKVAVKNISGKRNDDLASLPGHTGHSHDNVANETQESSQFKAVFDNYFGLKDAFVKTDVAMASAKATAILTALNAVEMGKLKPDEHEVWMKVEKSLKADAQQIKGSKEINVQRGHFTSLSSGMYELIKVSKPAEIVYYQFCPMANDGKGANWLSKESTIKNPYYGSQMLSCGKTVEIMKH